jgi:Methyltransferase small domain
MDVHTVFAHNAASMTAPARFTPSTVAPRQVPLLIDGLPSAPLTEPELAAACGALIGRTRGLTTMEAELLAAARGSQVAPDWLDASQQAIADGGDPLGDAFQALRNAAARRSAGAVYTPMAIVESMVDWIAQQGTPTRVVDPGAGSGRFTSAAARRFADAELVAVEADPLAALMVRATATVQGWAERLTLHVQDFRAIARVPHAGMTAFVGNPPYVRHHDIGPAWKAWYRQSCAGLGVRASALAGLHLHFFVQTRLLAKEGDIGAFITSAEWMDVNYGSALRQLLLDELGGIALHVLEPTVEAFPGTATTAAIACFRVGETRQAVRVRSVTKLAGLNGLTKGTDVARARLQEASRWSMIVRPSVPNAAGVIELGELFRVHRGQVTGANDIWIVGEHAHGLPERVLLASVTKARDLIQAGARLQSTEELRRVIDLPTELDEFAGEERRSIGAFLKWAKAQGGDKGYIAQHRRAWWSVGLKAPAPILCTYMARRPPQFTLNTCGARHINVAHGLYPRGTLGAGDLSRLVTWLNANISTSSGRTYAGGLTKFEPKEIERLLVPRLESLSA